MPPPGAGVPFQVHRAVSDPVLSRHLWTGGGTVPPQHPGALPVTASSPQPGCSHLRHTALHAGEACSHHYHCPAHRYSTPITITRLNPPPSPGPVYTTTTRPLPPLPGHVHHQQALPINRPHPSPSLGPAHHHLAPPITPTQQQQPIP